MRSSSRCRLCKAMETSVRSDNWNAPIVESEHFVVIPSLGALVEGWLLVVPKDHVLSAAALVAPWFEQLEEITNSAALLVEKEYGPAYIFEHGPGVAGRATGCGVDHAHIHIVPLSGDLRTEAMKFLPAGASFESGDMVDARRAIARGLDYLQIREPSGKSFVAINTVFESQTFRRAVASLLKIPEQYDWKSYPQLRNIEETTKRLHRPSGTGLASECDARIGVA